jgi:hypothetical protein
MSTLSDSDRHILDIGNQKLQSSFQHIDDPYTPSRIDNLIDNVGNFEKLRNNYKNSFIEIINETNCPEIAFLMTEKFLNSIYACNFPLICGSKGTVKFLRDFGFDMFDDVIDHSYDDIDNPIDRILSVIKLNLNLLTNAELTKTLWVERKDRFLKNVEFAKEGMYLQYESRAEQEFSKIIDNIEK